MKGRKGTACLAAVLTGMLLFSMSGCGGQQSAPPTATEVPTTEAPTEATTQSATPPADEPTQPAAQPDEDAIYVHTTRDLLESIAPGASIVLEPGFYNMSEYVEYTWSREGEDWNRGHEFVQLREQFDGMEVLIRNVEGLSIRGSGESPAETELVIDPRYSAVFVFEDCADLSVSNLTLGHTERGDCEGNVINLVSCCDVSLDNLDLYGCGVYALGCYQGTGGVRVTDSRLRDCSYGPLEIYGCAGRFAFENCSLYGSEGYAWYEDNEQSELAFYGCEFGENETSYFMFHEDVCTEDCVWSDTYLYPDYSDGSNLPIG